METQRRNEAAKDAEDLTPTPTQAENDAAMIAATGGEAPDQQKRREAEQRAEAERKSAAEPERRVPAR